MQQFGMRIPLGSELEKDAGSLRSGLQPVRDAGPPDRDSAGSGCRTPGSGFSRFGMQDPRIGIAASSGCGSTPGSGCSRFGMQIPLDRDADPPGSGFSRFGMQDPQTGIQAVRDAGLMDRDVAGSGCGSPRFGV
ncbi:hypothetical protein WISP_22560 [Willisornis vidua]|uniref:Uncharacterized protein n=1 Tax=Willisornis vidua TaxID=1566151 RepID=A0ABQ9DTG3_9PASS|nr:hypothetical protein WISP_22560 [Willisornis vidua]